ncbi:MAG: hypothetical protein WAL91_10310, partial [Propionicimonas sp.]
MTGIGLRRLFAIVIAALAALLALAVPAQAAEQVKTFVVSARLDADGTLHVQSTLAFDGAAPASLSQVLNTKLRTADNLEYSFAISDITVTTNGQPLAATVSEGADATTITVPTAAVTTPIEIGYTVKGAALPTAGDVTTVSWGLLQGLSVPVTTFDAQVGVPAQFTSVDCAAGSASAPGTCVYYGGGTHDSPNPFFHDENRAAGEVVVAILRFPSAAVA